MNPSYVQTVNLLLDIAPVVFQTSRFAMKGGTALNLFVQDLPRLSVDIDVVFIDHQPDRDAALEQIAQELKRIESAITGMGYGADIRKTQVGDEVKIFITSPETEVKVEVNFVFRGTVLPVQTRSLSAKTQALFSRNIQLPILSPSELYGSKLVAAMDRQHPRDIFDVAKMYESHGLTSEILDCFVVYLAGHNRPVHEVLFSKPQPMEEAFKNEFEGMASEPGYRKNKNIFNYQISHVFGRTKNVFCFTAPWNIVFLPKIVDPLTGHEAKGKFVEDFSRKFQSLVYDKFKAEIDEFNKRMRDIRPRITDWVEAAVPERDKEKYLKEFEEIRI